MFIYCKCHKQNPNHGGSNKDSPNWIKNKKGPINPINKKYDKCFQYAMMVSLNHEEMKKEMNKVHKE